MTKTLKRKPKAAVLADLDELVTQGRGLAERSAEDMLAMAGLTLDGMEWNVAVLRTLPQMTRGIQVVADFQRAGAALRAPGGATLEDEIGVFRQRMRTQIDVLEKAVDRWRKSNTRPLQ